MSSPFAQRCSNAGFDDRWTCPGCYTDFPVMRAGTAICGTCGRTVECRLEYEPVCVAVLVDASRSAEEEPF